MKNYILFVRYPRAKTFNNNRKKKCVNVPVFFEPSLCKALKTLYATVTRRDKIIIINFL